jgi:hypothetical protein
MYIGEKMLTGWTLLAGTCPTEGCKGTPLMSIKGKIFVYCCHIHVLICVYIQPVCYYINVYASS